MNVCVLVWLLNLRVMIFWESEDILSKSCLRVKVRLGKGLCWALSIYGEG